MKKIIAFFLSCILLFGVLAVPCFAQEQLSEDCCYVGDFNEDAKITAVDARMFLQVAAGVRAYDAARFLALDCNEDGKLNAVDARYVLQMASGRRNKVVLHLDTGEREVIGPPIYALEEAVSLVCAQTASAAAGGYTVSGNCAMSEDVDVGNATDVLNKVIQSVDPNADVNSVFGAFLGVGEENYTVQAADTRPVGQFDLQAFRLTAADVQQYYQEGYTLYFRLQDCQNPQENGTQSLAKVTNAFPTEEEIADTFQQQVGSTGMRVNSYQSTVSDILLTVVLSASGIESIQLHYVNDMDLELKVTSLSIQSYGQTTTDILYSDFTQA
ncbi:MAG: dockerin type I repeat-containing protein [Candidatus Fimenecus sp.]